MADYTTMNKEELINLCKEKGLATTGAKPVLIARLQGAISENVGTTSEKTENEGKMNTYAINAMRSAIIAAHAYPICNKKAITEQDAIMSGTTSERFHQWVQWVEDLREVVVVYCELKQKQSAEPKELEIARNRIFPAWRSILAVGEENLFHKNMFIRPEDVDSIVGYCETFMATTMGTQFANTTKVIFRKQIEALLGCRIAGNAVLKDADRDDLAEYYGAERTLQSLAKRLNGTTNDKGEHTKGILEQITDIKTRLEDGETMLKSLGVSEDDIKTNSLLTGFRTTLTDLEKQKKQCEESKKKAEQTIKTKKDRVEQIESMLKAIEG